MTIEEFGAGYALLVSAYRQQLKELTDQERKEQRALYYRMLREMDGALWQEVVGVAIQSSKWFPRVAELVQYAAELSRLSGVGGGGDQAFEAALHAVRRLDPLTLVPLHDVPSDVAATVRALGGWQRLALVENDQLGWYRKEFLAHYNGRNDIVARIGAVHPALGEGVLDGRERAPAALGAGEDQAWEGER